MSKRKPRHRPEFSSRNREPGPALRAPGGREWIYGIHAATAALANPRRTLRRAVATGALAAQFAGSLRSHGLDFEIVAREDLDGLLPAGAVHQGIALLADPLEDVAVEDVLAETEGRERVLLVALDQATDPHNVGAILRSAAAFGAAGVIVPDRRAAGASGTVAKAASGALETVPLVQVTNLARTLEQLKEAGFWCVGLEGAAETGLHALERMARTVVVLGSEGEGLRRLTRERCDFLARIPITSAVESLNLSNAAAIALYELSKA